MGGLTCMSYFGKLCTSFVAASCLLVLFLHRVSKKKQRFYFSNRGGLAVKRAISMENINVVMPDWNKPMTHTEFLEDRKMKNDDNLFSKLLAQMPDNEGCFDALVAMYAKKG